MSEIKVDKIQGTSGSSTAITLSGANATVGGTLAVTGVHTVGTNAVATSEGGAVTTNIAQGLIKAWAHNNAAGTSIVDSFNIASLTDTSAGVQRNTFTSAMSNATYSAGLASESSSETERQWIEDINSARYDTRHYNGSAYVDCITLSHVQGDLA